jgi:hypothetical protein
MRVKIKTEISKYNYKNRTTPNMLIPTNIIIIILILITRLIIQISQKFTLLVSPKHYKTNESSNKTNTLFDNSNPLKNNYRLSSPQ